MFKYDIDVECVFNIPNIVVDVEFKLFIDNIELVLNEFTFAFVAYTVKSGLL